MFIHSPPLTYWTHGCVFPLLITMLRWGRDKQRVYKSRSFIMETVLGSKSQNTSPLQGSPQINYNPRSQCIVTENTTFLCADPLSVPFLREVQSAALFWLFAPPPDRYGTRTSNQSGHTRLPITRNVQRSMNEVQFHIRKENYSMALFSP